MSTDLDAATKAPAGRFDGVLDAGTVARYVADSYLALRRTAHAVPRPPGPRYDVWNLPYPPGSDLDGVRAVRDDVDRRVKTLLHQLTTTTSGVIR